MNPDEPDRLLLNPIAIAIAISAIATGLNGITRAIVKARPPQTEDFFLGVGLVIGAAATNLTNLIRSLLDDGSRSLQFPQAVLMGVLFVLLLFNVALQQEVERRLSDRRPLGWVGWAANLLGFVAMASAIRWGIAA